MESIFDNVRLDKYESLPHIGKYGKNMFIATGFNLQGMNNSIVASNIFKDMIINGSSDKEKLFNLRRVNIAFALKKFKFIEKRKV